MQEILEKMLEKNIQNSKESVFLFFAKDRSDACRRMENDILLAEEKYPHSKVYKIILQKQPNTFTNFHVHFVPSVVVFKNGVEVSRITGTSYNYSILQIFSQFS